MSPGPSNADPTQTEAPHVPLRDRRRLSAADLMSAVYDELRALARTRLRTERREHTLDATALVNEVFIRMVDQEKVDWRGRTHFFAVASRTMRRVLVDHARARLAQKRGGPGARAPSPDPPRLSVQDDHDVLALEDALVALEQRDPEQSRIVEMRFFGGMTVEEVASALGRSKRSVEAEWTAIRAWLRRELAC